MRPIARVHGRPRAVPCSEGLERGSWLDLDLAQHCELSVFIGSGDEQFSLSNQFQGEQVNVWSVTHKDHWRRTAVAGDQRVGLALEGACALPIGSCNLAQGSIGYYK